MKIEQDPQYDARVVEHYRRMPTFDGLEEDEESLEFDDEQTKEYAKWSRDLGKLLNQLPMEGDQPIAKSAAEAAESGSVERLGQVVTFQFLSMKRIDRGAPALVDWLCKQGYSDVKYSLSSAGMMFGE